MSVRLVGTESGAVEDEVTVEADAVVADVLNRAGALEDEVRCSSREDETRCGGGGSHRADGRSSHLCWLLCCVSGSSSRSVSVSAMDSAMRESNESEGASLAFGWRWSWPWLKGGEACDGWKRAARSLEGEGPADDERGDVAERAAAARSYGEGEEDEVVRWVAPLANVSLHWAYCNCS